MDIDVIEEVLSEVHPGIYRYNSRSDVEQLFTELRRSVTRDLDEGEWMIKLAKTIKKLRCGHTYLNPWNMKKSIRNRLFGGEVYFPLGFTLVEGEFIITENLSEVPTIKKGDKLLSINDYEVSQILDSLERIAKVDGSNTSSVSEYLSLNEFAIDRWEAYDLYFYLFFRMEGSLRVEIEAFDGERNSYEITTLAKQVRASRYKGVNSEEWSLRFEANKAIMKLGTFATWKWKDFDYRQWLKDAFRKIDSLNAENLIIDLRGNSGGLGEIGDELASYLSKSPIECDRRVFSRTLKADAKFKANAETWAKWIFEGLEEGQFKIFNAEFYELEESFECNPIKPKEETFDGTVYFLGGPSNVSATFTLLKRAKELSNVYFVGTETGGNAQGINGGEYIFFYLPYSGAEIDIPLKFFSGGSDKKDQGVKPDFIAKYSQKSIRKGEDPHLDLVDELIKNGNSLSNDYILRLMHSSRWEGVLKYLDYQSDRIVTIPAALKLNVVDGESSIIEYLYSEEPHMNSSQEFKLDLQAGKIEGRAISSIENKDGLVKIVAIEDGMDAGLNATLRYTYQIGERVLTLMKEFNDGKSEGYTIRNMYYFSR